MNIMLNSKWKYIAKDKNDVVYMYDNRPRIKNNSEWGIQIGNSCSVNTILDISFILQINWKDSLHQILPDGIIKKVVVTPEIPVDTPVWVMNRSNGCWKKRHFSGWTDNGYMMCWNSGATSHSVSSTEGTVHLKQQVTIWDQYSLSDPTVIKEEDDLF